MFEGSRNAQEAGWRDPSGGRLFERKLLICTVIGAGATRIREAVRVSKSCVRWITVHRNCSPASVTIEDGFGFEAVVPVKSPI